MARASTTKRLLTDKKTLRERARQHIEQGTVTPGYGADRNAVVELLNESLATEIICALRYERRYYTTSGANARSVAQAFLEHANEQRMHATIP